VLVDVFERQRKLQHQRRQCEIGCASPGEAPCDAPAKELFPFWLGVPFLTTMHGRLDLPGLSDVMREFPEAGFVSISDHQRLPLPEANWIATSTDCHRACFVRPTGRGPIWRFSDASRRKRARRTLSASRGRPSHAAASTGDNGTLPRQGESCTAVAHCDAPVCVGGRGTRHGADQQEDVAGRSSFQRARMRDRFGEIKLMR
jgi:hypothetical protein